MENKKLDSEFIERLKKEVIGPLFNAFGEAQKEIIDVLFRHESIEDLSSEDIEDIEHIIRTMKAALDMCISAASEIKDV